MYRIWTNKLYFGKFPNSSTDALDPLTEFRKPVLLKKLYCLSLLAFAPNIDLLRTAQEILDEVLRRGTSQHKNRCAWRFPSSRVKRGSAMLWIGVEKSIFSRNLQIQQNQVKTAILATVSRFFSNEGPVLPCFSPKKRALTDQQHRCRLARIRQLAVDDVPRNPSKTALLPTSSRRRSPLRHMLPRFDWPVQSR